jgi:hypothetical protein
MGFGLGPGLGAGYGSSSTATLGYRSRNGLLESGPDLGPFGAPGDQRQVQDSPIDLSAQAGPVKKRFSDMTSRERSGLLGLAATSDPNHPDFNERAMGQDLMQLGLNLGRPE